MPSTAALELLVSLKDNASDGLDKIGEKGGGMGDLVKGGAIAAGGSILVPTLVPALIPGLPDTLVRRRRFSCHMFGALGRLARRDLRHGGDGLCGHGRQHLWRRHVWASTPSNSPNSVLPTTTKYNKIGINAVPLR